MYIWVSLSSFQKDNDAQMCLSLDFVLFFGRACLNISYAFLLRSFLMYSRVEM